MLQDKSSLIHHDLFLQMRRYVIVSKLSRSIQKFFRKLLSAPFQELPPEFGDTVPSELRVFEAEAEERQHHPRGKVSLRSSGAHQQTKAVKSDEQLERE
jgi:hypothetical protein